MATVKQKLAVRKVLQGTPIKHAMEQVGYAPSTADTTGKLTRSKGWKELMDKFISEDALMKVHKEGLNAMRGEEKDYAVRHKYLETGYKVRGRLKDNDKGAGDTTNNFLIIGGDQLKRIASRVLDGNTASEEASSGLPNSDQPEV